MCIIWKIYPKQQGHRYPTQQLSGTNTKYLHLHVHHLENISEATRPPVSYTTIKCEPDIRNKHKVLTFVCIIWKIYLKQQGHWYPALELKMNQISRTNTKYLHLCVHYLENISKATRPPVSYTTIIRNKHKVLTFACASFRKYIQSNKAIGILHNY